MLKSTKPLWVGIFVLALCVLAWPPARNLEYEYAIILTWCTGVVLPLLAYIPQVDRRDIIFSWREYLVFLLLPGVAFLPGWFMFRFGMCPCVENGFLFWMVLLVVPSCWLGSAGYVWVRRLRSTRWQHMIVATLPLVMAVLTASVIWFLPQKRITGISLGFLHGPIYDRLIEVDRGVVIARASHGILGLLMISAAMGGIPLRSKAFVFLISLIGGLRFLAADSISGGHGFAAIERHLNQAVESDGVVLHYTRGSIQDEKNARSLARDAAFDIAEIKKWLDVDIPTPIQVYAYQDASQKKLLFGGGDTDITDVFTPSVHVELSRSPHPTLRHELVHAVASYVGWHGLGFHPNMLVTEGLAMALAPVDQELNLDQITASMLTSGRLSSVTELLSPWGFWGESGSRSYVVAGSLIRWLQQTYGARVVTEIYRGRGIETAVGRSLDEILAAWREHVLASYSARHELAVERFDRDPGVFSDLCPHSREDLKRPASDGFFVSLRQPSGWDPVGVNMWVLRVLPENRQTQFRNFYQDIRSRFEGGRMTIGILDALIEAAEKGRNWPPRLTEDVEMAILQSDLESLAGRTEISLARLIDLQKIFVNKNPGSHLRRQVEVRLALMRQIKEKDLAEWVKYLAGWGSMPQQVRRSPWILNYLVAKRTNDPAMNQLRSWIDLIDQAGQYPEIRKEWLRMAARGYGALDDFGAAAQLYEKLAESSMGEDVLLARQNVRRMDFFKSRFQK